MYLPVHGPTLSRHRYHRRHPLGPLRHRRRHPDHSGVDFFAKFHTKLAIGTSLGAMLLPVGLLGAYAYYQTGNVNIKASLLIGLGLFLGAYGGARLAQMLAGATLQRMFAVLLVVMAVRLWIQAGRG
jgi:uncharacterized membrane protein YfcA